MTWKTNCVTFVQCDDAGHVGDPVTKIETGFDVTAGYALKAKGWTYNHSRGFHRCPDCTRRWRRAN